MKHLLENLLAGTILKTINFLINDDLQLIQNTHQNLFVFKHLQCCQLKLTRNNGATFQKLFYTQKISISGIILYSN